MHSKAFESRVTPSAASYCSPVLEWGALVTVLFRGERGRTTLEKIKQYVETQRASPVP
jgi:hypothetical protein